MIVSYYTRGNGYEREGPRLAGSCKAHNIAHTVVPIANRGDWHHNTAYKPLFLLRMRRLFRGRGPMLWVDADAVVHEHVYVPGLVRGADVALRHRGPSWLTGTIAIADTPGAMALLGAWSDLNCEQQETGNWIGGGQLNLGVVIDRGGPWTIGELPDRYCWIFDEDGEPDGGAAIEHLQASREFHHPADDDDGRERLDRRRRRVGELCG